MNIKSKGLIVVVLIGMIVPLAASELKDEPVALVGEREITRPLLNDAVNAALNTNYYHGRMTPERRLQLGKEQIQQLIRRELNILGALNQGMGLPSAAAEQSRIKIEERLGREAYEATLAGAGVTRKDHARALAETLLAKQAYEEFVLKPAKVSDEDIRTSFDAAPNHWQMPERNHLLHILLNVTAEADKEEIAQIRKQLDSLMEKLDAGEDFSTLAAEFSQDMYRIKGGDLGWVNRGNLVAPLEEAVWKTDIGAVTGPIRSQKGFHVAKVISRQPARPMEYAEVEPMIREQLEKQKLEAAESAWFDQLRKTYPVIILDPGLIQEN